MSYISKLLGLFVATVFCFPAQAVQHFTRGGGGNGGSAPIISSLTPTSGGTAGGTSVTISGSNLSGATAITFGGTNATSFTCGSTSCTAISPAGSSTENVVVTNVNGNSGNLSFLYQNFTQSFVAGTTDPNSNVMGGTELRNLLFTTIPNGDPLPSGGNCSKVAGCPTLLAFNGFWEDNNCTNGQGPQVLALTSSLGNWYLDTTFGGTAGCGGGNFNVTNSAYDYFVTYDGNGSIVSPPVEVVVAGSPSKIYARNNALGTWTSFNFTGDAGVERAIADHVDTTGVNPIDYLMLGNDADGSHAATWLASPWGYTINATSENFCQNWTSGTTCNTTCSPNTIQNCTNLQAEWPDQFPVTSGSSDGAHMTLNWSSSTALQAPLTPNLSNVIVTGITGAGCTSSNTTQTVTSATSTSVTFASTGTSCGYGAAVVSTMANIAIKWSGNLGFNPTGTATITGVTGCSGAGAINGGHTINYSTGTVLQFPLNSDCNAASFSGATVSGTSPPNPSPYTKTITSISSTVPGALSIGTSLVRIIGMTDCTVASGGNSSNKSLFEAAGMNIWRRVDNGTSSFWRLAGAVPYISSTQGAGFPSGQPQLRGLTCIATADSTNYPNGYELIAHIEGDGNVWGMNPDTGIFHIEASLLTAIQSQWGFGTYGIDAYNSQGFYSLTLPNGNSYFIFGEGDAYAAPAAQPYEAVPQHVIAYTGLWARSTNAPASASAPSFTVFPTSGNTTLKAAQAASVLNQMAQNTPQPPAGGGFGTLGFSACTSGGTGNCGLMISTRAGPVVSLFPEDGGQVLFYGGFDANLTGVHNTAWVGRAPTSMFSWP